MSDGGPGRGRSGAATLLCLVLLAAGTALALLAGPAPFRLELPAVAVAAALVPVYLLCSRITLDFEVRGESTSISPNQAVLALGVLAVAPPLHLAARLTAAVVHAVVEKQRSVKALFNLAMAAIEVGLTALAVGVLEVRGPEAALWLALLAGLLLAEVLGHVVLAGVWWLLGLPLSRSTVLRPAGFALLTTAASTGAAVVAVSAVWTEPLAAAVVPLLVLGAAHAYRTHRRLVVEQATTQELYAFVRDLGPVDAAAPEALAVLEQVRLLLHAERLDLALTVPDGGWRHLRAAEGVPARASEDTAPPALPDDARTAGAPGDRHSRGTMSTALVGQAGVAGLLTARGRLGAVRDFDLGDQRLFEALATELATAFERGQLLADLRRSATTDLLTGLPNLAETTARVDALLADPSCEVAVAVVAVESFREVNETLGHATGDELLREVARRLVAAAPEALVGRTGGGRFAVALAGRPGAVSSELFGLGLRAHVEGPVHIGMVGTHVRLSVGVARGPEHGDDAATLLRRAEVAVEGARRARGGPVVWAPAYEVQGQRRLAVVSALRSALATDEIGVVYQPKVDALTGEATGVEALARWTHPALGAVPPSEFIPLAEAAGLLPALTGSVLRQALTACRGWQRRAGATGVSVNVSADTVLDPQFAAEVTAALASTGADPALLTLELTEDVLVADPELARHRMDELHALGVRLAVDDFGTGYSSLTYLKRLPIDEVKIDKAFVDGVVADAADRSVVQAVVDIAHTLGMRVVAEGVERVEQQAALQALGVDELQGYLHARPMPALAVAGWLRGREVRTPAPRRS
jgi:diguanylate cyclase (GGDEF)-like protein